MNTTATSGSKSAMSEDHKAALSAGRKQGRAVRAYLEALEAHKPKRGRKRTAESIAKRISAIDASLDDVDALKRLQLVQERMDLEAELASMDAGSNLDELEAEFIEVAREYSQRKGISYAAFRELGVSAATLKSAGVSRAG